MVKRADPAALADRTPNASPGPRGLHDPEDRIACKKKHLPGDEPASLAPAPKAGLLPTGLSRALVIGSVVLALAGMTVGLFGDRYALIPAQRSENAVVYRIDRLTGSVAFCSAAACVALPEKSDLAN